MDLDTCNTLSSKGKPTKEHRKEGTEEKQGHIHLGTLLGYNEGNFL